MNWTVRHQGSPRSVEGLTPEQIVEGLQEGSWEATDEVMGPSDTDWVSIEDHPVFADAAEALEPPPQREHEDEARLDMNPLIDVCLVLLIFFILTTSYLAIQKVLDMPGVSSKKVSGPPKRTEAEVREFTIKVVARSQDGRPHIKVEDESVELDGLQQVLRRYVAKTRKTELLLDARGIDWGSVIAIQDAAKGAGVNRINYQVNVE